MPDPITNELLFEIMKAVQCDALEYWHHVSKLPTNERCSLSKFSIRSV